ncbi:DNA repair protein RAD51 homolog 3-like isoform X2 [Homarus americanus]|nr:DNA repair protein RAD51 homolog 3-like isoform X2 [Homarus americanus]
MTSPNKTDSPTSSATPCMKKPTPTMTNPNKTASPTSSATPCMKKPTPTMTSPNKTDSPTSSATPCMKKKKSDRLLSVLGLPATIIFKLLDADFVHDEDVQGLTPMELSSATGLTLKESAEVVRLSAASSIEQPVTILQMLKEQCEVPYIATFCEALDSLLGGGIPLRAITEIYGTPGIGKTQMCLQACVSVQLPSSVGGVGGEALFIDTEGSFTAGRLKDMATDAIQHAQTIGGKNVDTSDFTDISILKGIHYFRCLNYIEIVAVIKHLPSLLKSNPKMHLIVIDSIAFHFRHDFPNVKARAGLLCHMTQELIQLATKFNLAVIVTNQMTTKIECEGSSELVAALGETWGHCPTLRLALHWSGETRVATLTKAPHRRNSSVNYQVTLAGIRDLPSVDAETVNTHTTEMPETKKRKLPND